MTRFPLSCLIVLLAGLSNVALAQELHFVTEESPPYNMVVNGKLVGIATEKVAEMMKRAGRRYQVDVMPWARAYLLASVSNHTCVFSATRTPEREEQFKWIGPLGVNLWSLYGLADRHFQFKSLEDARPFRIGTYIADGRDAYLRARGFQVDAANSDAVNLRKLLLRRIDLWASGPIEAGAQVVAQGLASKVVPVLTFNRVELFLACHRDLPDQLVDELNGILHGMSVDGTSAAIERRYQASLDKPQ